MNMSKNVEVVDKHVEIPTRTFRCSQNPCMSVTGSTVKKKPMVWLPLSSASLHQQVFPELPCIDRRGSSIAHRGVNKTRGRKGRKGGKAATENTCAHNEDAWRLN